MLTNRMTPARRQLIQMAAGLMGSVLDAAAPMNRTRAEVLCGGIKDGGLLRSHRAVSPSARLPLVRPAAVQETVQTVMAVELADEAFAQIAPTIEIGETERQVAWRLEVAMREAGAESRRRRWARARRSCVVAGRG